MSAPLFVCVLPLERLHLAVVVRAAGGVPVIDLAGAPPDAAAGVDLGDCWVRVRASDAPVPGTGPVIINGARSEPVPGRDTWLEVVEPATVPPGYAGVVLRGREAGGMSGVRAGMDMLANHPTPDRVLLDAAVSPAAAASAIAAGAAGIVLSDVLLALPELGLPPRLSEQLNRADASTSHVVNGWRIQASPLAPALRRMLAGEAAWELSTGWFGADDPRERVWPAGLGLPMARQLAAAHPTLAELLAAYQAAITAGPRDLYEYVAEAQPVVRTPDRETIVAAAAPSRGEPIAVIGLGSRFPGSNSVAEFWQDVLGGVCRITEVPPQRWDPALHRDDDRHAEDRTYASIGGFLHDFQFEPRRFRIPPGVASQVDEVQQTALESVADALEDAGYAPDARMVGQTLDNGTILRAFDRNRTAVILGNSMGGEVTDDYVVRARIPAFRQALERVPGFAALPEADRITILDGFEDGVKGPLPRITEDSMPGELANVIAGRIANAFDLTGPNFTVDAACASSMAALQTAVKGLQDGDFDTVITGGADRSMGIATYIKFCKIGALSARHSVPFDAEADGFVMGEGCGILVLKRLADAERDGDRIYALIRGIGGSSDGKGKGITAPNPRGQLLALQRAYASAAIDPVEVDLFECHGTSTVVGDRVEVEALTEVIGAGRRGERGAVHIGSVKSNIGHLKSAAGAASCIKMALALHHRVYPPSVGFRNARPDVPMDAVPLQVQTVAEPWTSDRPRLAGVSAFGFGGTNFHVVMQEYVPGQPVDLALADLPPRVLQPVSDTAVAPGVWAVSAEDRQDLLERLKSDDHGPFEPAAPVRLTAAAADPAEQKAQAQRAITVLEKGQSADLLRARNINLEEEPFDRKLAFVFTGQGSQYVDMGLDLADEWAVAKATFDEADAVMLGELGRPLSSLIRRDPSLSPDEQDERLRATEISQPATLTVDVAILRVLAAHGVYPDMVAGHSLGEYAAAVAAGILSFPDALIAVSARGREMASVKIDDKGRMAGIAASVETISEVLAEVPGYIVPANKNCPSQTVIAGESFAVEAALEAFRSRGITVYPLPVSHAFHSRIVAPATEPLKRVLERLDLQPPRRPITTNVTSRYYPHGEDSRAEIIDILARQVASPVEWIAQIERMYADGARVFVECGPKRALTGFVVNILRRRPHRALYTNHPKRGGVMSIRDTLAALTSLGMPVRAVPSATVPDLFATPDPRRATTEAQARRLAARGAVENQARVEAVPGVVRNIVDIVADATGYDQADLRLDDDLEADLGIDTVKLAEVIARVRDRFKLDHDPTFRLSDHRTLRDLADYTARRLGAERTSAAPSINLPGGAVIPQPRALVAPRGPAPMRQAAASRTAPSGPRPGAPLSAAQPNGVAHASSSVDLARAMAEGAVRAGMGSQGADAVAQAMLPAFQALVASVVQSVGAQAAPAPPPTPAAPRAGAAPAGSLASRASTVALVCSGAAIGLPGGVSAFDDDNFEALFRGQNRIARLPPETTARFVSKNIVRVRKDAQTGAGDFEKVVDADQVIRLAGLRQRFNLSEEYGVDPSLIDALDITTQMAFAAGLDALRDAGIPLVRRWKETTNGGRIGTGWALPEAMADGTGVIFASAFPGFNQLVDAVVKSADPAHAFDRRFLFQILSMGHSQFAQFVGARGPNLQINTACASTTSAVSIAQDWLQLGRCDRVIVVGADDVTNDSMLEWVGAGFIASGAATFADRVEDGALPFDRRRHGMILGAGAVGMILEREDAVRSRGVAPLARLLASRMANSAFHGSRLDPNHIAGEMDLLVGDACRAAGVDRATFAREAVFVSHETYTPAKGGSAAAEIESLRRAFGPDASRVVVTNTKGFTGHTMGAGIEDALAIKVLQYGKVPPIPNLRDPDPDLGDLSLSTGGAFAGRFAIRLAAGFGSQLALLAWEGLTKGDARVIDATAHQRWLREITGGTAPVLRVEHRTLRAVDEAESQPGKSAVAQAAVAKAAVAAAPVAPAPAAAAAAGADAVDPAAVLAALLDVVGQRTGYGADELDPSYELEADLGIDTVKQAEIFGEVRDRFGIPRDDAFRLADYPTLELLSGWLYGQICAKAGSLPTAPSAYVVMPRAASAVPSAPAAGATAPAAAAPAAAAPVASAPAVAPAATTGAVLPALLEIVAARTGYGVDELDPTYELEADLGIDTVKQAEIFSEVRDRFGIPRDDGFRLADYATLEALAGWLESKLVEAGGATAPAPAVAVPAPAAPAPVAPAPAIAPAPVAPAAVAPAAAIAPAAPAPASAAATPAAPVAAASETDVRGVLIKILSARTGYSADELDPDYELEADLGIDTVKQAEIFGEVRDRLGIPRDEQFRLADYPTIAALSDWLEGQVAVKVAAVASPDAAAAPDSTATSPAPTLVAEEQLANLTDDLAALPDAPPGADATSTLSPLDDGPNVVIDDDSVVVAAPETDSGYDEVLDPRSTDDSQASVVGPSSRRRYRLPPPTKGRRPSVAALPAVSHPPGLPDSFRLRRPVLVERAPAPLGSLRDRVVHVVGTSALAMALREELTARGARLDGPADAVIDAGEDVRTTFELARGLAAHAPRDWLTLTRVGGDPSWMSFELALESGSRAGFTKALGREWADCHARVLDLDPTLADVEAASAACDELAGGDSAIEIFRDPDRRRVVALETVPFPARGQRLPGRQVIVLTGGTRGITAQVARALAQRMSCRLALLARTGPALEPLLEDVAKASIRAALRDEGVRATPARIERALKPLRAAEEARKTVEDLRALGAEVQFFAVDLADASAVKRTLDLVRQEWGSVDGVVHGAGIEESRLIADKSAADFDRVFNGKAVGGLALVSDLEPHAWFVSMGSVAGRFGNPGQVDYAAANDAMARICLARPHSLHVDWTAWADVGMAVRGGMERLLTERGVELLPAGPGAELLVDMLTSGLEGELVVAGAMGDFVMPPLHPLLDIVELVGDGVVASGLLSTDSDPWMGDHAIDSTPVLPGVIGLEMMAGAAELVRPGLAYAGAREVEFKAPLKLHRGEPVRVIVRAEPAGPNSVRCQLSSERTNRAGRLLVAEHFTALIDLGTVDDVPALASGFFPEEGINQTAIYRRFFHGPAFQVLREATTVAQGAVLASAVVEHAFIAHGLLTAPLLLEAAFQAAGLHRMAVDGVRALPAAIEQVVMLHRPEEGASLHVVAQQRGELYDVDVDGPAGPALRLRGFRMIETGPLPPGDRFPVPEGGWPGVLYGSASPIRMVRRGAEGALSDTLLPSAEVARLRARGTDRRVRDRIAGRIAAHRALAALTGRDPLAFELVSLPSGRPAVANAGRWPEFSLSHRDGQAVAAATWHGLIGIDLERAEPRSAAFQDTWLLPAEIALAGDDPVALAQIWSLKEAVIKALGEGMRLDLHEVGVVALAPPALLLTGRCADLARSFGGERWELDLQVDGDRVVATALLVGARRVA